VSERSSSTSARWQLEPKSSLSQEYSENLGSEHAAPNPAEVANQEDIPARSQQFATRNEPGQVRSWALDLFCKNRIKLRRGGGVFAERAFRVPLDSGLLPDSVRDGKKSRNVALIQCCGDGTIRARREEMKPNGKANRRRVLLRVWD
jgi:hypothetical protein